MNGFCATPRKHNFLSLNQLFHVFRPHYLSSFIAWSLISGMCNLVSSRNNIFCFLRMWTFIKAVE